MRVTPQTVAYSVAALCFLFTFLTAIDVMSVANVGAWNSGGLFALALGFLLP